MTTPFERVKTALDEAIQLGKLLDVSELSADGTGSRKKNYPKGVNRTKKYVPGVALVSNNYTGYKLATDILGYSYARYAQEFLKYYGPAKYVVVHKPEKIIAPISIPSVEILNLFQVKPYTGVVTTKPFTPKHTPKPTPKSTLFKPTTSTLVQPANVTYEMLNMFSVKK